MYEQSCLYNIRRYLMGSQLGKYSNQILFSANKLVKK